VDAQCQLRHWDTAPSTSGGDVKPPFQHGWGRGAPHQEWTGVRSVNCTRSGAAQRKLSIWAGVCRDNSRIRRGLEDRTQAAVESTHCISLRTRPSASGMLRPSYSSGSAPHTMQFVAPLSTLTDSFQCLDDAARGNGLGEWTR
jgi:hypothetical protein